MQNYEQTILSQFANSPTILSLIESFNDAVDPRANIDAFYENVWNIETASGYGLDVWGRVVGVSRVLQVSSGAWLGFEEAGDGAVDTPFNVAPFYNGTATTGNYALTDDAFRTLILAKAAANITNGSIPSINQILMILFGSSGACWCTDGQNMTMTYTFEFQLSPVQFAIVAQSGVLPRPAGVQVTIIQIGLVNDGGVVTLGAGIVGWPTSPSGLSAGALYSNGGVVCVAGTTTPNPAAPPVYLATTSASVLLALGGANLPISLSGLANGQLWNNGGVLSVA
ncbi:DUF2612 domain-containing protein [Paraburkholderia panacisoli]|uniref:DUF2612 domain-containing protein n=1 Tax=Paraburkholderia panacisoli TaxID=2603818 RepID=A0A5B0HDA6_9BURK|nr:DUF2612 domain-containing protein [Paraburkholderia panacisoli]KAA1013040.1 DUF2612 domain-containing protein [Paraburkholderia panacisoli]